jgi:hypothetical protein
MVFEILNSVFISFILTEMCTNATARNPNKDSGEVASDGYHKYKVPMTMELCLPGIVRLHLGVIVRLATPLSSHICFCTTPC